MEFDLGFIDINEAEFYSSTGGFAGLKYKGEDYAHIILRRIMPMAQPFNYISVAYLDGNENKEIGILKTVGDLPQAQKEIVTTELDNRYYSPEVLE
ncbi:MAG: DUF1854 domain-containing protein, partial [Clostridiales bacterium]|nr:DUF1854 domain-containing protein [Clostridiales bacterium]